MRHALGQEALTKTGIAWARVRLRDDPEAYVRRVMYRLMCNRWRRPAREWLTREPPDKGRWDPAISAVEREMLLQNLIAALPARQRAVLVLRYFEDLTESQIAEELGCSTGTVKSQAHKGLQNLRRQVATGTEQGSSWWMVSASL